MRRENRLLAMPRAAPAKRRHIAPLTPSGYYSRAIYSPGPGHLIAENESVTLVLPEYSYHPIWPNTSAVNNVDGRDMATIAAHLFV